MLSRRIPWQQTHGNSQNWAVAQGPGELIYVANTGGILEYDGGEWRMIEVPVLSRALVHSLAVGPNGRLYAGGIGEVGVLLPDSTGTLRYRSLVAHIPDRDRAFTAVWTTHATPAGIVFQSFERLFRWNGRRMESWRTDTRFRSSFLVGGTVHVWEDGVGIKALSPRGLALIPGGAAFAERKVDALLPYGRGLLAVVRDEGLVVIERGGRSRPLPGAASAYLVAHRPYTAVAIPDRASGRGVLYAVGTFGGGVALVAPDGRLVRVYREDVGLTEGDDVIGVHPDRQGGLWVALNNGIARIDLFARHTWFDERDGFLGGADAVAEHDGTVYVGTNVGLFRQTVGRLGVPGDGPAYSRFEPVAGLLPERTQVWDILSTPAGLLVAAGDGVYVLDRGRSRKLMDGTSYVLVSTARQPGRVMVGTLDGVAMLSLRGGRWVADGRVAEITGEIRSMQEDAAGALWVSQPAGVLYRLPRPDAAAPVVEAYSEAEGVRVAPGPLSLVGSRLLMSTREGVFRIEHVAGHRVRLVRDEPFADFGGAFSLIQTGRGLWTTRDGALYSNPAAGFRMAGVQPNDVLVLRSGVAYVASSDGLMRYDPTVPLGRRRYAAVVRRVTDRRGTVFFGGAAGVPQRHGVDLEVPFTGLSGLRFELAASLFDRPGRVEFSTRMLGLDDETWSPFAAERVAQFVGIREGTYTFEVRGRDDLGRVTEAGAFRVRILPPWYRTWWAYTLYGLTLAAFIWAFTAWRLRKQKRRTETARARNERMQRLGARLRETNARLRHADKLKDDLLANTSHELRTPLTAVLGFSEILVDEVPDAQRDLAEGVQRGGKRLLATVDGLLDMFKLQSGTMERFDQDLDAALVVRDTVRMLAPLAAQRSLTLRVFPEGLAVPAHLDRGALERILTNVIGNAIKFTDEGGVTVLVDGADRDLVIAVTDTGIGIPAGDTERIFEPFEQASTGFSRSHEGTGLGLAIVRRLVDLLGGSVAVESAVGRGTTVRVTVPRWSDLDPAVRAVAAAAESPALGGATLLAVGLGPAVAQLRAWVEPRGVVCAAETTGPAVREAKRRAYDAVFVAAGAPDAERRRVAALRYVPGYQVLPVLRVGGDALGEAELAARGFTHQLALPLDAVAVVTALEALLMTVEADVDDD